MKINFKPFLYPTLNEVEGGYTGFTLSVCPSVHLWTESCPLCIFYNMCQIYTSYQATAEGVSLVKLFSKFKKI